MKDVAPEERPKVGQLVNDTRARSKNFWRNPKRNWKKLFVKKR